MLYKSEDPEKAHSLTRTPEISTANLGSITIHSRLWIKPGTNLLALRDKNKVALRGKLAEVKLIMIDEASMVSSDVLIEINIRIFKNFLCEIVKLFLGISMGLIGDLF